jgi:hypothetical protein
MKAKEEGLYQKLETFENTILGQALAKPHPIVASTLTESPNSETSTTDVGNTSNSNVVRARPQQKRTGGGMDRMMIKSIILEAASLITPDPSSSSSAEMQNQNQNKTKNEDKKLLSESPSKHNEPEPETPADVAESEQSHHITVSVDN